MTGHAKLRIAIGAFHDVTGLRDALDGLGAIGCSGDDIVLLLGPGAFDGQLEQQLAGINDTSAGSIRTLRRGSKEIAPEQRQAKHPAPTQDQVLHFETWLPSQYTRDLDDHLGRGGCVLFCTALSETMEQALTKVLLQYSEAPVQLHDLPGAN